MGKNFFKVFLSVAAILAAIFFFGGCKNSQENNFERSENFMHTVITLKASGDEAELAVEESFERIAELEKIILEDTKKINAAAGNGNFVRVSPEVYEILGAAKNFSELTDGAFDVTIGAAVDLWKNCRAENRIPTPEEISAAKNLVGSQNLILREGRVKLEKPGMKINLGGIAKGYGVDEVRKIFSAHGIEDGLIDFGTSTIFAFGTKKIGLKDPHEENKIAAIVEVTDGSISTSGDYENFFVIDGKKFHHILNPKTCMPVEAKISSASVIVPGNFENCSMTADVLSTTAFILGEDSLKKILPDGVTFYGL